MGVIKQNTVILRDETKVRTTLWLPQFIAYSLESAFKLQRNERSLGRSSWQQELGTSEKPRKKVARVYRTETGKESCTERARTRDLQKVSLKYKKTAEAHEESTWGPREMILLKGKREQYLIFTQKWLSKKSLYVFVLFLFLCVFLPTIPKTYCVTWYLAVYSENNS